jgi:integrase
MGIKQDPKTKLWEVTYSKRPKGGGPPKGLKRTGITSKRKAKIIYDELVALVHEKLKAEVLPTWSELYNEYIEINKGVNWSLKTAENYQLCLDAHTRELWGDRLVDSITTGEIRDLININLAGRSESQKKNVLKYIRGPFTYAHEKGLIPVNPVPNMKFRIGDKLEEVLTKEQAKYLLKMAKKVNHEWYPHWMMALYTGMRNGELYALTWDHVDLKNKQIEVKVSWNNKEGFKDTKSGDDRIVEIAPPLIKLLKELKQNSQDTIYVLPRIDRWDKGDQASVLRMFLLGLGLPRIKFHSLRATWATIAISEGVPPAVVMAQAGWKDLKTMQRYIRRAGIQIKDSLTKYSLE